MRTSAVHSGSLHTLHAQPVLHRLQQVAQGPHPMQLTQGAKLFSSGRRRLA